MFNSKRRANGLLPLTKEDFQLVAPKIREARKKNSNASTTSSSISSSSSIASSQPKLGKSYNNNHALSSAMQTNDDDNDSIATTRTATSMKSSASTTKKVTKSPDEIALKFKELAKQFGVSEDRVAKVVSLAIENGEDLELDDDDEDEEDEDRELDDEQVLIAARKQLEEENCPIGANISIFDNVAFSTVDECVEHMAFKYGFFIPDQEYLTDRDGFLLYLNEKVKLGGMCLYCQKQLKPGRPCQNHMKSKSHCKVKYEEDVDMEEFEDFYDFTSTYDGISEEDEDRRIEINEVTNELILLDGRTLGHRAFRQYYKQRYRPQDERPSVVAQQREQLLKYSSQFGAPITSMELVKMSDSDVMSSLVSYHKQIRKGQIMEQRAQRRKDFIDQRREYRSSVAKLRSSETTTAKIRDYHKLL